MATLHLKPIVIQEPFKQWGIDFICVINPSSSVGHKYILIAIDYFTKWVESNLVKHSTSKMVCHFLNEKIICRFGVPYKIVVDNAATFSSQDVTQFCFEYGITLAHSSDCYPQGNGEAKSSNKNLVTIIKKLVDENQ